MPDAEVVLLSAPWPDPEDCDAADVASPEEDPLCELLPPVVLEPVWSVDDGNLSEGPWGVESWPPEVTPDC